MNTKYVYKIKEQNFPDKLSLWVVPPKFLTKEGTLKSKYKYEDLVHLEESVRFDKPFPLFFITDTFCDGYIHVIILHTLSDPNTMYTTYSLVGPFERDFEYDQDETIKYHASLNKK